MRQMAMIVVIAMAVMALRVDVGMAIEDGCQSIYVDIESWRIYRARGDCYIGEAADKKAQMRCEEYTDDPSNCVAGSMSPSGKGIADLSWCGNDEYIALACVIKNDRPYCILGFGESQPEANNKAIATCDAVHSTRSCKLQDLPE